MLLLWTKIIVFIIILFVENTQKLKNDSLLTLSNLRLLILNGFIYNTNSNSKSTQNNMIETTIKNLRRNIILFNY